MTKKRSKAGVNPNTKVPVQVKWLILLTSFSAIGYGYLTTAISAYLPELGVDSGQVGLIIGLSGLAMIISAIPFGLMSDRLGRKRLLLFGLVLLPLAMFMCSLSTDTNVFILAGILSGVAEGAILSTWNAMIADMTTVDNRDVAFSLSFIINGAFSGLGFALPFVFPYLMDLGGWTSAEMHSWTFVALGFLTLVSPVTVRNLLRDHHDRAPASGIHRGTILRERSKRTLVRFSINNTLIGLGAGLIIPLISTWFFLRYDVPDTYSGPLLALSSISIGLAAIFSTRLGHRFGPVRAIVLTQGFSTIFMLAIPFMPGAAWAGAIYLIRSAMMNMAGPIMDSYLMGIVDKEDRGLASAINSIVWRVPNSVTTVIGGAMLAAGYYELPFILAALIYMVAVTAFYFNFRNVKVYDEKAEAVS
ncbi:MAG: MFS transporter [Methanomassiliicoccales archaeon]|nr:MFS transporter [Methanomassiliicoccales archaeon]